MSSTGFNKIEELVQDLKLGKMVLLVDDEDRENEGDLVLAADHVTAASINFMATEARGLICLALTHEQIERLRLPLMVREDQNYSPNKTAFTISIEASQGVSTGISAADRAHTVKVAAHPMAKPQDVRAPGHVFPIRAQSGGVLKRAGHTEGSVDLAKLAGLNPAAVICEVMNPDGTMARVPDLRKFAEKHDIKIGTIVDLIEYRLSREILVEEIMDSQTSASSLHDFRVRIFKSKVDGSEHLVLQLGEIDRQKPVLVRVQNESSVRDLVASLSTGKTSLALAVEKIRNEGQGVVLLLRDASRAHSITGEMRALLADHSALEMDKKDYGIGAQVLRALGIQQIRLLSNRVDKRVGLRAFDLQIVEVVGMNNEENSEKSKPSQFQAEQTQIGH